jgi:small neutral amino acid transporter SnatA (MarC family)
MTTAEYALLALSSLFVIVDPIAAVPAFVAMTSDNSPGERLRMARMASVVAGALLLVFAVVGNVLFRLLGITIPAFQMAGSVVGSSCTHTWRMPRAAAVAAAGADSSSCVRPPKPTVKAVRLVENSRA